jgi:hypothetical protein
MVDLIQFNASAPDDLERFDLSFQAISNILLGPSDAEGPPIRADSPPWARFFIAREYRACEENFRSLRQEFVFSPQPRTGEPVRLEYSFIPVKFLGMSLPVFKVFGNFDDRFCLVYSGLTSRVTHIILPRSGCVIYDLDRDGAQFAWDAFEAHSAQVAAGPQRRRRIGVVDMITSYAHQAMNHLSGMQRLVDADLTDTVDEIWISGTEFFGKTEDIFPEVADKIRHVDRREGAERLSNSGFDPFKIGSNFVTASLRERLLRLPTQHHPPDLIARGHWPLLAVTVRSIARRCVNLPDVVQQIVEGLLPKYPNLGVVLDGWVFPETSIIAQSNVVSALSEPHLSRMREEALLCKSISARLPPAVLVYNTVGMSMLESIHALRDIDVYFAHVGTLQHKIAWFTRAHGIVHGPQAEISRMESSYYASEMSNDPVFIDIDQVDDIPPAPTSDQRSFDYRIRESSGIISVLDELISARRLEDHPKLGGASN